LANGPGVDLRDTVIGILLPLRPCAEATYGAGVIQVKKFAPQQRMSAPVKA
jgi:hypothetical protein